jgi:hypothetical protein
MAGFWVIAPCRLVWVYQSFRGPYCHHHQGDECLMMEAVETSETLVNSYQSAWHYNPEDSHIQWPILVWTMIHTHTHTQTYTHIHTYTIYVCLYKCNNFFSEFWPNFGQGLDHSKTRVPVLKPAPGMCLSMRFYLSVLYVFLYVETFPRADPSSKESNKMPESFSRFAFNSKL